MTGSLRYQKNGEELSIAQVKRHPDGYEPDGVFTPQKFRGHRYAGMGRVVRARVEACHNDIRYMHPVPNLTRFFTN